MEEQNQFSGLICKIEELLTEPSTSNANKKKLKKAKSYLLSENEIDWEKGMSLLGKVITGASTLYNLFKSLCNIPQIFWDWLRNLF